MQERIEIKVSERKESESEEIKRKLIIKSLERQKTDSVVPKERRKGEDVVLKIVNMMSFLVWGIWFVIIAIIDKAGKGIAHIQKQGLLWASANFWRVHFLEIALTVTAICIAVCTVSIIMNLTRYRRRSDKINKSIILCEFFTFVVGIFLMFKLYK